jgi:hypothetical protein
MEDKRCAEGGKAFPLMKKYVRDRPLIIPEVRPGIWRSRLAMKHRALAEGSFLAKERRRKSICCREICEGIPAARNLNRVKEPEVSSI